MGSQEKTYLLGLPQFGNKDKPTWRGDVNAAFRAVERFAVKTQSAVLDKLSKGEADAKYAQKALIERNAKADFGLRGDNETDDSDAAIIAVNRCAGQGLYWPEGRYLINENLPGFWDVNHSGPGVLVLRDGAEFKIEPTTTDITNIYTDGALGSFGNDGLSPSSPTTLPRISDILRIGMVNERRRAQWVVNLRGTYAGGYTYSFLPPTIKPIVFQGEPLINGKPVTRINWDGNVNRQFGLRFDPCFAKIDVNNIEFNDFSVGFNGYGVLMKSGGYLNVANCVANNCDMGFAAINNVVFYMRDTTARNCKANGFFASYSASGTWNNCTSQGNDVGFSNTRNCVTHIDYCTIIDNTGPGIRIDMAARSHVMGCNVWRNRYGVDAQGAGEWVNDTDITNDFGYGTANANTIAPWWSHGVSRENRGYAQTSMNEHLLGNSTDLKELTGSTADTMLAGGSAIGRLMPLHMVGAGKKMRFHFYGSQTGAGTKTLKLTTTSATSGNSVVIAQVVIPANITFGQWDWEIDLTSRGTDGSCRVTHRLFVDNAYPQITNGAISFDMSLERWFRFYIQNSTSEVVSQLHGLEIFAAG